MLTKCELVHCKRVHKIMVLVSISRQCIEKRLGLHYFPSKLQKKLIASLSGCEFFRWISQTIPCNIASCMQSDQRLKHLCAGACSLSQNKTFFFYETFLKNAFSGGCSRSKILKNKQIFQNLVTLMHLVTFELVLTLDILSLLVTLEKYKLPQKQGFAGSSAQKDQQLCFSVYDGGSGFFPLDDTV